MQITVVVKLKFKIEIQEHLKKINGGPNHPTKKKMAF